MIYLDASIIIRLIEGEDRVRVPIENRLKEIPDQECVAVTSRLSLLECRCKPVREGRGEAWPKNTGRDPRGLRGGIRSGRILADRQGTR